MYNAQIFIIYPLFTTKIILPFLATAVVLAVIDNVLSLNSTPVAKLELRYIMVKIKYNYIMLQKYLLK